MRAVIRLTILLLLLTLAGSIFIAEGSLHIWHKETPSPAAADSVATRDDASWSDVKVTAPDGSVLDAWLFTPRRPNRSAVIALHGVGDTRLGMLGHVDFLLRAGYTVLAPDFRGHGSSGGDLITFGVREANDVHLWADLLLGLPQVDRLYGIGQSMGAAILLESLTRELHAINPTHTELWEVPGAGHVASLGAARQEYIRRVTAWLDK